MGSSNDFSPALIVVDMQEDFCEPHGSLGIPEGRSLAPLINRLLSLPFAIRAATLDWHSPDSLTFASSHGLAPFTSTAELSHPTDPSRTYTAKLWPDHCVANTFGSNLIPEIDSTKLDFVVKKGMDAGSEMFSGFKDCFGRTHGANDRGGEWVDGVADPDATRQVVHPSDTDLARQLREKGVRQVYCVGLAGDVCVKSTALDAAAEGFEAYWIEDAQRCVSEDKAEEARRELREAGVKIVRSDGEEMKRVWALAEGSKK